MTVGSSPFDTAVLQALHGRLLLLGEFAPELTERSPDILRHLAKNDGILGEKNNRNPQHIIEQIIITGYPLE